MATVGTGVVAAQDQVINDSHRSDLAAMVLDQHSVPPGYTLLYETYIPGNLVSHTLLGDRVSGAAVEETGLLSLYESTYVAPDGAYRLRSYVFEFIDDLGAARGFGLLEDESLTAPSYAILEDEDISGIGEDPSELTVGSYSAMAEPGDVTTMDLTFRMDHLIAGVSIDAPDNDPIDRDQLFGYARTLETRIGLVLADEAPESIDLQLGQQLVYFGADWAITDEGYLGAQEQFGPNADNLFASRFVSGYVRGVASGSLLDGGLLLPRVTVAIAKFTDEAAVLQVFNEVETYRPLLFELEEVRDGTQIEGADASTAFKYLNPYLGNATYDSFRIVALYGSLLITVDVQGNQDAANAALLASMAVEAQIACLELQDRCDIDIPASAVTPSEIG